MAFSPDSASSSNEWDSPSGGAPLDDGDSCLGENNDEPLLSDSSMDLHAESSRPEAVSNLLDARAYQREMFEASMQQNIILAVSHPLCPDTYARFLLQTSQMDTGSGKTQVCVAVLHRMGWGMLLTG